MAHNNNDNNTNGHSTNDVASIDRFDPTFTQKVVDSMGPRTSPRMREIMTRLIPHLHDFAREVELTVDEWMMGVQLINRAGQMSDNKRNEGQLLCDVVGLESLVDEITYKKAAEATDLATQSAILGPFFREDHPTRENGSSIHLTKADGAEDVLMHGKVVDASTGEALADAVVDVWMASTNGLYEQQDDNQVEHNLRGKFFTDSKGDYSFYCIRPTPYPVPFDGPAGELLQLMDRHPYRPAHIHLIVGHPPRIAAMLASDFRNQVLKEGYKPITTQIFDRESKYLDNDSVFAVKNSLVVDFVPLEDNPNSKLQLKYDVRYDILQVMYIKSEEVAKDELMPAGRDDLGPTWLAQSVSEGGLDQRQTQDDIGISMWLLNVATYQLEQHVSSYRVNYAILSHTWEEEEIGFHEIQNLERAKTRKGWAKIEYCCRQAKKDNLTHCWIDTCCIDQKSSAELSEAINSMYQYYEQSTECYAYLSDFTLSSSDPTERNQQPLFGVDELGKCRWFSRGWTLQELIAPYTIKFYGYGWKGIGSKQGLVEMLTEITKIPSHILSAPSYSKRHLLASTSVAARMSWASNRQTTRLEDVAYCLLGIFDIHMPLLYGEGTRAFKRLQQQIVNLTSDHSILLWKDDEVLGTLGIWAANPNCFQEGGRIVPLVLPELPQMEAESTPIGLRITLPMVKVPGWDACAILNCRYEDDFEGPIVVPLTVLDRKVEFGGHQWTHVCRHNGVCVRFEGEAGARFPVLPSGLIPSAERKSVVFLHDLDIAMSARFGSDRGNVNILLKPTDLFHRTFGLYKVDPKEKYNHETQVITWRLDWSIVVSMTWFVLASGTEPKNQMINLTLESNKCKPEERGLVAVVRNWQDESDGHIREPPADARRTPSFNTHGQFGLKKGMLRLDLKETAVLGEHVWELCLDYEPSYDSVKNIDMFV